MQRWQTQVGEEIFDSGLLQDRCHDRQSAGAVRAVLQIAVEHPLEPLAPHSRAGQRHRPLDATQEPLMRRGARLQHGLNKTNRVRPRRTDSDGLARRHVALWRAQLLAVCAAD